MAATETLPETEDLFMEDDKIQASGFVSSNYYALFVWY